MFRGTVPRPTSRSCLKGLWYKAFVTSPEPVKLPQASAPRVGVGVLILNDAREVLLTQRKRPPEAGYWSIAGGKVEFMETLEETAVREAREETGLDVELVHLLCVTDHFVPAEAQHWVSPAYLARAVGGQLANLEPDTTEAVRFFPLHDLPERLTLTAENALAALRARGV